MNPKRNRTIGIVLALFVYPGAGHFYMGFKKLGIVIAVVFTVLFAWLLVHFEMGVLERLKTLQDPLGMLAQGNRLMRETWTEHSGFYQNALWFLVILWIASVGDLFWRKPTP